VGEAGCIGVPAALMNAARDALSPRGEPVLDFPPHARNALARPAQRATHANTMKYTKSEAKEYARENMVGCGQPTSRPSTKTLRLDENAYRNNLKHWIYTLHFGGRVLAGKQAEFFSMTWPSASG